MALVSILLLQGLLISYTFPLSETFTQKPLFHNDAAFHWYQMKVMVNLAEQGHLTGYDPFFNAGYIGGIHSNGSAKGAAVIAILFHRWISEIVVYKVMSILAALLAPLCVPVALSWLGFSRFHILVGAVLGFLLWWASWFRWMHTTGMVAFVFASYIAVLYVAAVFRYLHHSSTFASLIMLGLAGAAALLYHPLFSPPVIGGTAAYAILNWRTSHLRLLQLLIVVPILSVLPNLSWMYSMYDHGNLHALATRGYMRLVDITLVGRELLGLYGKSNAQGSVLYAPLLLASIWACLRAQEQRHRQIAYALTVTGVMLVLFAAVGAAVPTFNSVDPNRFTPTGYLLLVIPATVGLVQIVKKDVAVTDKPLVRIFARAATVLFIFVGLYAINEVRREVSYADIGHYGVRPPEVKGLGPYSEWVLKWLSRHTTKEGRVLFEDSLGRVYDGAHLLGYYAYQADREFIGGPFPFHHFAGFWDRWLFNRPISGIEFTDMRQYFDLYNIGWIIVHTDTSKRYFDSMPGVVALDGFREVKTYRVDRPLSFFIKGEGQIVERTHNRLVVTNLAGDEVILRYHFYPGLKSAPAADLTASYFLDDPVPFVKITNPPKQLLLEYR